MHLMTSLRLPSQERTGGSRERFLLWERQRAGVVLHLELCTRCLSFLPQWPWRVDGPLPPIHSPGNWLKEVH